MLDAEYLVILRSLLNEGPQRNIDAAQLDVGLGDKLESLFLIVRDLPISDPASNRTHVTLRRSRQRRDLAVLPRHLEDMIEETRCKTSTAGPPRGCEKADIIMVRSECVALKRIDGVMELLSERFGARAELTWFWVGRIADGVRASSSALYGFCVGLVLPVSSRQGLMLEE